MTLALDTNILIEVDLLNQTVIEKLNNIREKISAKPVLPSPVISEYYYGFLGTKKKEKALKFVEGFDVLNTSKNSSLLFAELRHKLMKSGKILTDMDILIASICIDNNATLVTMDKQFEDINELNKIILNV